MTEPIPICTICSVGGFIHKGISVAADAMNAVPPPGHDIPVSTDGVGHDHPWGCIGSGGRNDEHGQKGRDIEPVEGHDTPVSTDGVGHDHPWGCIGSGGRNELVPTVRIIALFKKEKHIWQKQ